MYPRRAQQLGITGECLVRYTVTTSGTVRDVEVVPDGCSDPLFARPSINAARHFKYKPRVIDGTPVEVLNVYNMFHFETAPTSGAEQ
ncbi:MAG: energy transducer TonB [Chromatocurvus sp.]